MGTYYPRDVYLSEKNLQDWLKYIYPDFDFIMNEVIPVEVWDSRNAAQLKYRRFRPDARNEELNLIVEFDGINHYNSVAIVYSDVDRDNILTQLGYKVVRIPFFVQLTTDVINFKFGEFKDGSMLTSGFHSTTNNVYALNPNCPANFCAAGLNRFYKELDDLPTSTYCEILETLEFQLKHNERNQVLPESVNVPDWLKYL